MHRAVVEDVEVDDDGRVVVPEAWAPRVSCREHGVVVAAVPWARHDSSFTERVMAEQRKGRDLFADLKRIGIDEIAIRKGH